MATFFAIADIAGAVVISAVRLRQYPDAQVWWNAEGAVIWLAAAMICGGLLFG